MSWPTRGAALDRDDAPARMQRSVPVPWQRLVWGLICWAGVGWLTLAAGWWWRVAPAHAALAQVRDTVLALDQQVGAQRVDTQRNAAQPVATHPIAAQPVATQQLEAMLPAVQRLAHPPLEAPVLSSERSFSGKRALDSSWVEAKDQQTALSDDDVSALVRWHALLHEQHLSDWQGRSIPAVAGAPADGAQGGVLWRLEGVATYQQGVDLLNAMVRQFPRLVLLHVQVQRLSDDDRLQWRLELRWSAPLPAVAQRWPAQGQVGGGSGEASGLASGEQTAGPAGELSSPQRGRPNSGLLSDTRTIDPFAADRLPSHTDHQRHHAATLEDPSSRAHHVLPRAPLNEIRLVGVVARDEERVALVTWTAAPTEPLPSAGRVGVSPRSHRVRLGQTLGAERAQVVAIEPQAVVLQPARHTAVGRQSARPEVLALAGASASLPVDEERRP